MRSALVQHLAALALRGLVATANLRALRRLHGGVWVRLRFRSGEAMWVPFAVCDALGAATYIIDREAWPDPLA